MCRRMSLGSGCSATRSSFQSANHESNSAFACKYSGDRVIAFGTCTGCAESFVGSCPSVHFPTAKSVNLFARISPLHTVSPGQTLTKISTFKKAKKCHTRVWHEQACIPGLQSRSYASISATATEDSHVYHVTTCSKTGYSKWKTRKAAALT